MKSTLSPLLQRSIWHTFTCQFAVLPLFSPSVTPTCKRRARTSKSQRASKVLQGRWNFRTEGKGEGSFWGTGVGASSLDPHTMLGRKAPMDCIQQTPALTVQKQGHAQAASSITASHGYLNVLLSSGLPAQVVMRIFTNKATHLY